MPNLTSKELAALEDQLNSEQLLVKKYRSYAQSAQDPAVKAKFEQVSARHQQHFDKLMTYLG